LTNAINRTWRQPTPRAPRFRGTRDLRFTPEEVAAIRRAERVLGYDPELQNPPFPPPGPANLDADVLARLVGVIVRGADRVVTFMLYGALAWTALAAIMGFVQGLVSHLPSRATQTPAPRVQSSLEYHNPRHNSPLPPPADTSGGIIFLGNNIPRLPALETSPIIAELEPPARTTLEATPQEEGWTSSEDKTQEKPTEPPETQPPVGDAQQASGSTLPLTPEKSQPEKERENQVQQQEEPIHRPENRDTTVNLTVTTPPLANPLDRRAELQGLPNQIQSEVARHAQAVDTENQEERGGWHKFDTRGANPRPKKRSFFRRKLKAVAKTLGEAADAILCGPWPADPDW